MEIIREVITHMSYKAHGGGQRTKIKLANVFVYMQDNEERVPVGAEYCNCL